MTAGKDHAIRMGGWSSWTEIWRLLFEDQELEKVFLQHSKTEQYLYSEFTEHKSILATQSYRTVLVLWIYKAQKYSCNKVIQNSICSLELQSTKVFLQHSNTEQ